MGLLCSKNLDSEKVDAVATKYSSAAFTNGETHSALEPMRGSLEQLFLDSEEQKPDERLSNHISHGNRKRNNMDDFYDGIPLVPTSLSQKSRSMRSTQAAVAKVSEVSVRLGRAGTMGLEKAVEVLDVLGSSMTDLNSRSGFASVVVSRGTKVSILAFEVANTIMKGVCLMNSLSESHIRYLKEEVLPSDPVQKLVSKDMDELLKIVASDKREELTTFSGEVVRFGNRCKDPQWHNLDRYFLKQSTEVSTHKQLKDDAETMTQQLMALVQYTAELYHELQALHRIDQDWQSRSRAEAGSMGILREELKKQKKLVMKLKKRSLWNRSLEEIMEKLVDIVLFLSVEIHNNFGSDGQPEHASGAAHRPVVSYQRLGPAGLALHYANIILQVDGLVARSCSMPPNARESLYQSLPPSIKSSLRSKLQSLQVREELTVAEIKAEMEKTLHWLVPVASNTVKSHHGFGWVGEWANSGFEASEASPEKADLIHIETLYHADKVKTEAYITDQLVWLHYLVSKSMASLGFGIQLTTKAPAVSPLISKPSLEVKDSTDSSSSENHDKPADVSAKTCDPSSSESENFDTVEDSDSVEDHDSLSKSSSHSPSGESNDLLPVIQAHPSGGCFANLGAEKQQGLNITDQVNVIG